MRSLFGAYSKRRAGSSGSAPTTPVQDRSDGGTSGRHSSCDVISPSSPLAQNLVVTLPDFGGAPLVLPTLPPHVSVRELYALVRSHPALPIESDATLAFGLYLPRSGEWLSDSDTRAAVLALGSSPLSVCQYRRKTKPMLLQETSFDSSRFLFVEIVVDTPNELSFANSSFRAMQHGGYEHAFFAQVHDDVQLYRPTPSSDKHVMYMKLDRELPVQASSSQLSLRHMENHLPLSSFPLEHWSQLYLRRPMSFVFEIMASGNHSIVFDCTATTHDVCRRMEQWLEVSSDPSSTWRWQLIRTHSVQQHCTDINDCSEPIIDTLSRHYYLSHCRLSVGDVLEFRLLPAPELPAGYAHRPASQSLSLSASIYNGAEQPFVRLVVRSVPPPTARRSVPPPEIKTYLLFGERIVHTSPEVIVASHRAIESTKQPAFSRTTRATLCVTNYRLMLEYKQLHDAWDLPYVTSIPLGSVDRLDAAADTLVVRCKDFRRFQLAFPDGEAGVQRMSTLLIPMCFRTKVSDIFAFWYREPIPLHQNGWFVYDAVREFDRMGVPNRAWRLTLFNQDYSKIPTYPRVLAVPQSISDAQLEGAIRSRSKGRVPTLSYLHTNGASICRCSQPLTGIKGKPSSEDQLMLDGIRESLCPPSHDTELPKVPEVHGQTQGPISVTAHKPVPNLPNDMIRSMTTVPTLLGPSSVMSASMARTDATGVQTVTKRFSERASKPNPSRSCDLARSTILEVVDPEQLGMAPPPPTNGAPMRPLRVEQSEQAPPSSSAAQIQTVNLVRDGSTSAVVVQHATDIYVFDARPRLNALANRAKGAGYESETHYRDCKIKFLNIDNIHDMRSSLNSLLDLCQYIQDPKADGGSSRPTGWLSGLAYTKWLDHSRLILRASLKVARCVHRGHSALVHCSDGWDRTPQITSLAQLMLSNFYRTIVGFEILIEKEWLSFGHQFAVRVGQFDENHDDTQRSPVFVQFLDCTWQLLQQFPHAFEFNAAFLRCIAYHSTSGRFGTFLFNTERDRVQNRVAQDTPSVWSYINCNRMAFLNPFYSQHAHAYDLLSFHASESSMQLWRDLYAVDAAWVKEFRDLRIDQLLYTRTLQEQNRRLQFELRALEESRQAHDDAPAVGSIETIELNAAVAVPTSMTLTTRPPV